MSQGAFNSNNSNNFWFHVLRSVLIQPSLTGIPVNISLYVTINFTRCTVVLTSLLSLTHICDVCWTFNKSINTQMFTDEFWNSKWFLNTVRNKNNTPALNLTYLILSNTKCVHLCLYKTALELLLNYKLFTLADVNSQYATDCERANYWRFWKFSIKFYHSPQYFPINSN
jgi:hypothetical protein